MKPDLIGLTSPLQPNEVDAEGEEEEAVISSSCRFPFVANIGA